MDQYVRWICSGQWTFFYVFRSMICLCQLAINFVAVSSNYSCNFKAAEACCLAYLHGTSKNVNDHLIWRCQRYIDNNDNLYVTKLSFRWIVECILFSFRV